MSRECRELHRICSSKQRFTFPYDPAMIPPDGLYVLFEEGETGHGADRIVRVGSHTGDRRLSQRLGEHFVRENKDRSIFRKNIGRALLNREGDPFLEQWNLDLTSRKAKEQYQHLVDFGRQRELEEQVTAYIQDHLSFVVFRVEDAQRRRTLELNMISTVSLCEECRPSPDWLGLQSPVEKIRESGLWQVQGVCRRPRIES